MPETTSIDGTGVFLQSTTNAGLITVGSFSNSSTNLGTVGLSATFTGTAVNSGVIGSTLPFESALLVQSSSANWNDAYNTVSELSSTWSDTTVVISDVTGLQTELDGKQAAGSYAAASHTHAASDITDFDSAADARITAAAGSTIAQLVNGSIPAAQLPSYVDDVEEVSSLAGTGEAGKIYVLTTTNKTYRWSGSAFVEISPSPGSTDSVTEGSTNLYFTNSRAVAALTSTVNTLSTAIDGKQVSGSYAAASHTHAISSVTGLQTALDGKQVSGSYAAASHTHSAAQVTDFNTTAVSVASANLISSATPVAVGAAATGTSVKYSREDHSHAISTIPAGVKVTALVEGVTLSAVAATGTVTFDVASSAILYYTSNATATFTINLTNVSSELTADGQSLTVVFMNTNGSSAYGLSALQIGGATQTVLWQSGTGSTPTATASATDVYTFTAIRRSSGVYTVLGSLAYFK